MPFCELAGAGVAFVAGDTAQRMLERKLGVFDPHENYRHSEDIPGHIRIADALLQRVSAGAVWAIERHIQSITRILIEVVFVDD